jgi:hypothetical protein
LTWRQIPLIIAFVVGCGKTLAPEAPADKPESVLEMARTRPVHNPVRARFHIKLRSDKLDIAGSTGGGLIVNRPGQGHMAVFGPLGSPLVSFTSDGAGLAVTLSKDRRHLMATEAEEVIHHATGGAAGLDDILAILVGDLPFDKAKAKKFEKDERGIGVHFKAAGGNKVHAIIDPSTGTPRYLEAKDPDENLMLSATYEDFEQVDERWMPTRIQLWLPMVELEVDLKFRQWKPLDEVPDVFSLLVPDGHKMEPLEELVRNLLRRLEQDTE